MQPLLQTAVASKQTKQSQVLKKHYWIPCGFFFAWVFTGLRWKEKKHVREELSTVAYFHPLRREQLLWQNSSKMLLCNFLNACLSATVCMFPVLLMIHWVRDAVKQFSGDSNGYGMAPNCSLKNFIVTSTEACGAQLYSNVIQCSAKVRCSTTWQITFQLSMAWYCTTAWKHSKARRSTLACLTLD